MPELYCPDCGDVLAAPPADQMLTTICCRWCHASVLVTIKVKVIARDKAPQRAVMTA